MPVRVMRPGGLFTKARNCGTPRALAAPRNQRSGACRVQSYFPSAISKVSAVRHGLLILSVMPPPMLNRQQESPIPPVCENSKSPTLLRLGRNHVPNFCMLQQSEAEMFSIVWYSESRRIKSDRKSTRLNSSHLGISYAVFCLENITLTLPADLQSILLDCISHGIFSVVLL